MIVALLKRLLKRREEEPAITAPQPMIVPTLVAVPATRRHRGKHVKEGDTGYIGRHTAQYLKSRNYRIDELIKDISAERRREITNRRIEQWKIAEPDYNTFFRRPFMNHVTQEIQLAGT